MMEVNAKKKAGLTGRLRKEVIRSCAALSSAERWHHVSLLNAGEDARSACLMVYRGQSTEPFFSGKDSSPTDRARPIRASNSSRVPRSAAGVQPIPSNR